MYSPQVIKSMAANYFSTGGARKPYVNAMTVKQYHGDLRETYGQVLNQNIDNKKGKQIVTPAMAGNWHKVIAVQDRLEELRNHTDKALRNANTKLNPYFMDMQQRAAHKQGFGYEDLVPESTRTRRRQKVINATAMNNRTRCIKEDVGILAYMRDNNLAGQHERANQMLSKFEVSTAKHPVVGEKNIN